MHGAVRASLTPLLALAALAGLALVAAPAARAAASGAAAGSFAASETALHRLADRLRRLEEDGLDPAAYGVPRDALALQDGEAWRAALRRAAAAALADLLLGRVREPPPGRADLRRDTAAVPLAPWMAALAASAEPAAVLDRAALATPGAAPLKAALARARAVAAAGGWPAIPGGAAPADTIEPGAEDELRVPLLRARLAATDPQVAREAASGPGVYDEALVAAVRRFQAEQGLEADGRVGRLTLAALNRPPEALVRQLRVALDMRRAAAAPGPERRIEVNIAHQRLAVLEGGRTLLEMAVVVGRPSRPTPTLRVRLAAVQFNPPWGVPERNAKEDLLPRFRRDPRAMMEKGFRVYAFRDGERVELDPTGIDWRGVSAERFPYLIRQDAGEANALGRIKFVIPNGEDIFMHDTPDRHLFRRPDRAFSSGCIRLERPMELLDIALEGLPGWDRARVSRVLDGRQTVGVTVARALPVRLHYTTVVVDGGEVRVRPDIYRLDEAYARALDGGGRARVAEGTQAGAAPAAAAPEVR